MDYVVPNFGQDNEIKSSLKNLADQEAAKGFKWNLKEKEEHPMDYKVPNFGLERDIVDA